jgi:hypothetical protein
MNPAWRRSEPREIRPFFAAAAAEKALEHAKIRLFGRDAPSDQATHVIEPFDFPHLTVALLPELDIHSVSQRRRGSQLCRWNSLRSREILFTNAYASCIGSDSIHAFPMRSLSTRMLSRRSGTGARSS